MTARTVRKQVRKGGMAYMDDEPEMDYAEAEDEEGEDDLSDLLDEEPQVEDDESEIEFAAEIDNLYKAVDERDKMILQLAKATRTLAKRVMALEAEDEDEAEDEETPAEDKEDKRLTAKRLAAKQAPESDFSVGGDDDLGEPEGYQGGESQEPGLTAGEPQGIAEKAFSIAKSLDEAGVPMSVIAKTTGFVKKDDRWSNFGEKDSEIPGNAAVTPDTKDWPSDLSVVPGSGQAPDSVKGIGSVAKALGISEAKVAKALAEAGLIRKAAARPVGAGAQGGTVKVDDLEQKAREMSFQELNQIRIGVGDL